MKKCPYCNEEIQDDAKKCKYCAEWLEENERNISEKSKANEDIKLPECKICGERKYRTELMSEDVKLGVFLTAIGIFASLFSGVTMFAGILGIAFIILGIIQVLKKVEHKVCIHCNQSYSPLAYTFMLMEQELYWKCTCGMINDLVTKKCLKCNKEKQI